MSIPPLVCSTPPPPEQCEDDKDPEDFDLTYNLSQDDDDDENTEYNYGNYSSYSIYTAKSEETDTEKWQSHICKNLENTQDQIKSEDITNPDNFISHNIFDKNVSKFEENILEDLNLKVETEVEHSNDIHIKEYETESDIYNTEELSDKDTRIQDQGGTNIKIDAVNTTIEDITSEVNTTIEDITSEVNHIISPGNEQLDFEIDRSVNNVFRELPETYINNETINNNDKLLISSENEMIIKDKESDILNNRVIVEDENKQLSDDDFGDFEDFQIKSSNDSSVLPISDSPWDNNTNVNSEFGAFTANFDSSPQEPDKPLDNKENDKSDVAKNLNDDDDEDFGDFDDYKSSTNDAEDKEVINNINAVSNVPVLNFQSHDNEIQVVDTLNNVLTSIFSNEIPESDNSFDDKLELYLSETWGHLIDIDVRQPYIVNWNNSLGQKTLLKALCIDSRNILFGHKWNYSMPKYAANLSTAPLQPQKQQSQPTALNTDITEKPVSGEVGAWGDPFTPDGQEYTYAEALLLDLEHLMATLDQMAHKHSTLKISELLSHACSGENKVSKVESPKRPTDLDVFGSNTSANMNKIYSNTIGVQPLRQISLPDTHIFTPTDSETPRSKTIHYDDGLVLVPNAVLAKNKSELESTVIQAEENDSKYWEFQDFKGTNAEVSIVHSSSQEVQQTTNTISDTASKPSVTYQTQILQPIKMEPIIPTLNWPDPGEVKETFDDFSDFISSTSWNNDKKDIDIPDIINKEPEKNKQNETNLKIPSNDDDFETFQSAPVKMLVLDNNLSDNKTEITESSSRSIVGNVDKIIITKFKGQSDVPVETSISSISNNVTVLQNLNSVPTSIGNPVNCLVNNNNILQPTSSGGVGPARSQHSTGQILQPLSLESYSQINWPNPGIDLQDLSRFNPVNSLQSLKCDINSSNSKGASPAHNSVKVSEVSDDDIWGDFVSSMPKPQTSPKKPATFADDDEWSDFVSSPSIRPQNGLNTISLNVHTNLSMQKSTNHNKISSRSNQMSIDIPTLNYITPKSNNRGMYTDRHFQNL